MTKSWFSGVTFVIAIVAVIVVFSGLFTQKTTYQRARQEGSIRVGYSNEAPYAYLDTSGRVTGAWPEVARLVLDEMGIRNIQWIQTDFGLLISELKRGRIDLIAVGMFITPERAQEISFSTPIYKVEQGLLVKAGNPLDLHSYEDIAANPEVTLAVVSEAVERQYALAMGVRESQIYPLPDPLTGLAAVRFGRADCLALTHPTIQYLAQTLGNGEVEVARPFEGPVIDGKPVYGYGGYGFRKEDAALLKEFDRHLLSIVNTPQYLELIQPFGFTQAELPGLISLKDLLEE